MTGPVLHAPLARRVSRYTIPRSSRTLTVKALAANSTVLIDVKTDKDCPTPVYDFAAGTRAWSYHELETLMTVLPMDPAKLPAAGRALFAAMAAKRKAHGEGFGGPYVALLNHPELARRIEELGFLSEIRGRSAAPSLSVHRALGRQGDRRGL